MATTTKPNNECDLSRPITASYIDNGEDVTFLIKVPVQETDERLQNEGFKFNKVVMIALDRSYSMVNSPFDLAKLAIAKLFNLIYYHVDKIIIFIYDHGCTTIEFKRGDSIYSFENRIKHLQIGGGTEFNCVFKEIHKHMNLLKTSGENTFVSCLFFTDGQDFRARSDVLNSTPNSVFSNLKHSITEDSTVKTDVHVLGFGSYHDALLLSKMSEMGCYKGTFQYVESAPDIPVAVSNLTDILKIIQIPYVVQLENGITIPLNVDHNDEAVFVVDKQFVSYSNLRLAVNLKQKRSTTTSYEQSGDALKSIGLIKLTPLDLNDTEDSTGFVILTSLKEIKVKSLAAKVFQGAYKKLDASEINTIGAELDIIDKELIDTISDAAKFKSNLRKQTVKKIQQVRTLVNQLRGNIAELRNGSLTNEKIAKWQSLASQNALLLGTKGQRTLGKRTINNATEIEKMEIKIEEIVNNTDFDQLRQNTDPKLINDIMCYMTRCNFLEAMEDGDCIGLGLQVRRSEATVFDPSQLQILNVGPTFVTCEAFMDLLSYKLTEGGDNQELHGGFDNNATSSVATGIGSESINAVLPLYINKEHWSIASKRSMSILSWICTLSLTGGSGLELKTVPFLVLAKCITDYSTKPTQHNATMLKLVFETCLAVYTIPFAKNLRDETKEQYQNYLNSPGGRTVDCVNNHSLFLAKLLCAIHTGDIDKEALTIAYPVLKDAMVEEIVRRQLNAPYVKLDKADDLLSLFELNAEKVNKTAVDINFVKESAKDNVQTDYATMFKDLIDGKTVSDIKTVNKDSDNLTFTLDSDLSRPLPESIAHFIEQVKNAVGYKVNKHFIELEFLIKSTQHILDGTLSLEASEFHKSIFKNWCSKKSQWWLLATFIQSYKHRKNDVRRQALTDNTYLNFLTEEGNSDTYVYQYLNSEISKLVQSKIHTLTRIHLGEIRRQNNKHIANLFRTTPDIDIAAGILRFECKFTSVKLFKAIIDAISTPTANLPTAIQLKKLNIMVTGKHKNTPVYKNFNPDKSHQWLPNPKITHDILLALQGRTDVSQPIIHQINIESLNTIVPGCNIYLKRRQKFEHYNASKLKKV